MTARRDDLADPRAAGEGTDTPGGHSLFSAVQEVIASAQEIAVGDGSGVEVVAMKVPIAKWEKMVNATLADLLAAEFALREVLDVEEAADAVLALKDAGFVIVAPQALAEAALVREARGDV